MKNNKNTEQYEINSKKFRTFKNVFVHKIVIELQPTKRNKKIKKSFQLRQKQFDYNRLTSCLSKRKKNGKNIKPTYSINTLYNAMQQKKID